MPEKAMIVIQEGEQENTEIAALFNPQSYQLSYRASYSEKKIAGLDGPISQYLAGESMTLEMTLFFDTYIPPSPGQAESGTDVSKQTGRLSGLLQIDVALHRPPIVKFKWGTFQFKGIVTSVKENYTMFLSDGTPVRARADISFQSVLNIGDAKRGTPLESPDRTKVRIMHEKEQLWHYAFKEYGDAEKWREIAAANGILNPLETEAGMMITLPAII